MAKADNQTPGKLYLCATPIGNLEDASHRLISTLSTVDIIAAEDTRRTVKLLNHFNIKTRQTSYFEHNKREKGEMLIGMLQSGKNVALVSDAGTPAISDPGEDLVRLCIQNDIQVISIPGACALINALIISGLDTKRFSFYGFLTINKRKRKQLLDEIKETKGSLIFYEAPHKLKNTLNDLYTVLGDRSVSICRELSKIHENVTRTTLSNAANMYLTNTPKGEFVLVVEGYTEEYNNDVAQEIESDIDIYNQVNEYIRQGRTKNEAIKLTATKFGIRRNLVYKMIVDREEAI